MEPHMNRVQIEHDELDEKLEKLHVFIEDNPIYRDLPKTAQRLLLDQRAAMTVYRDILRHRLAQ